jgi:hypothetical protein
MIYVTTLIAAMFDNEISGFTSVRLKAKRHHRKALTCSLSHSSFHACEQFHGPGQWEKFKKIA